MGVGGRDSRGMVADTNAGCPSAPEVLQAFRQTRKGRICWWGPHDADDNPAAAQSRCNSRNLPPMLSGMLCSEDEPPFPPCHIPGALQQALHDSRYHEILVKPCHNDPNPT